MSRLPTIHFCVRKLLVSGRKNGLDVQLEFWNLHPEKTENMMSKKFDFFFPDFFWFKLRFREKATNCRQAFVSKTIETG